ncbi:MAG: hypothetical protein K0R57_3027 [Paenibacillaceae bacterium]|jgi:hypothetical protein|nr:hypothetical protein [Paenibacillaceae bacterium]
MAKNNIQVPFGYEVPADAAKGTLIVYDDFTDVRQAEVLEVLRFAGERAFAGVVFYPIHEETARRMGNRDLAPYYRRLEGLQQALEEAEGQASPPFRVAVDQWEGKRKKYTPVETAMDFLTEKHKAPFFVWMRSEYAAKWAEYASFPLWIRKLRLVVAPPYSVALPAIMKEYESRWEYMR